MAHPIRVYCDDPEYVDTWIDIEARWTLAEMDRMVEVAGDDFWAFLRGKAVACNIQTAGGAISDPAEISAEGLRDVDVLLIGWLGRVLPLAVAQRRALGNASARLSLPSNGQKSMMMTAAPTPTQ